MTEGSAPLRVVPAGPWWAPALFGAALCTLLAGGAEAGWRAQGQRPTADPEDLDLWAKERLRAANGSSQTLVIIGKSRAQLDFDRNTLARRYPGFTRVQLALRGRGAFAVFEDLVRDPDFKGRILFSLDEPDLALEENDAQLPAVERARRAGPDALVNAWIRAEVASRVVVRSALLFPQRVLENLSNGHLPAKNFVVTERDRFGHADFTRADLDVVVGEIVGRQQRIVDRMGDLETPNYPWLLHIQRVPPLVEELRQKGGDVAFVHLPVSGPSEQFSMRFYPKHRFWDLFATRTPAVAVHYRDYPVFRSFRCADTSHLDEKDAPRFTVALMKELERRGFMPTGTGSW